MARSRQRSSKEADLAGHLSNLRQTGGNGDAKEGDRATPGRRMARPTMPSARPEPAQGPGDPAAPDVATCCRRRMPRLFALGPRCWCCRRRRSHRCGSRSSSTTWATTVRTRPPGGRAARSADLRRVAAAALQCRYRRMGAGRGKEVMLHLPMRPRTGAPMGPAVCTWA